ncbi:hypothetical protein [Chryseobacterium sp. OV279]|uniref:hypothetical protein n=1 Tax=Chryseobacterium sp. OV279 TaxID=1500285 RepID=UPI0009167D64|nr:hypothetical protein [Chryseobacterium sp. OV279]SHG48534.1 hypothetical protein SAMN02787100_4221 [Chryseobacterium sp. OV279]
MKKRNILKITFLSFLTLLTSCTEELVENNRGENTVISESVVKNGRLYFPNKESLTYSYNKVKNADDEAIANYIDSKDIISLRPVVTEKNEAKIASKISERIELLKTNKRFMASKGATNRVMSTAAIEDDIDDLEELVGDDAYAAFLNSEAEIQVADDIYKYTDAGLFIVKADNYPALEQYLAAKNISNNLLYPTPNSIRETYVDSMPSGQRVSIPGNPSIEYYNNKGDGGFRGGGGTSNEGGVIGGPVHGGGNTYTGGFGPAVDPTAQMNSFINGLQDCSTYTTWLQDLFGDSDMCVDRYEDRRRVKTKAYNYDYYLVYNLGVKVKHQYKGWTGLWRKEKADEIRLGVIGAAFYYDYASYFDPVVSTNNRTTTIYNNNNRYVFDANTFWAQDYLNPGLSTISGFSISGYPKIFKDNYYIEDVVRFNFMSNNPLVDQGIYAALQAGNKQLSYNYLNKIFWENVVKKVEKLAEALGQTKPDNNITYSYNAVQLNKMLVQKTYYENQYNTDDVEKTFDWGFQIGFNIDSNGSVSPSTSPNALKKPQDYKVIMYGIVKKNGAWHGSKINTNQ